VRHFIFVAHHMVSLHLQSFLFKTTFNNDSIDILFIQKYCKLFMHGSNTFLFLKYTQKLSKPMGKKNSQNLPFVYGTWTPSNTPITGPTPLTTPNGSLIGSHTFTQLCHRVPFPIGYDWTSHIYPQIPLKVGQSPILVWL